MIPRCLHLVLFWLRNHILCALKFILTGLCVSLLFPAAPKWRLWFETIRDFCLFVFFLLRRAGRKRTMSSRATWRVSVDSFKLNTHITLINHVHFVLLLAAAATKQSCVRPPAAGFSSKLDKEKENFRTASSPGSEFLTCCWASEGVFAPSCDNGQKVQVWIGMSVSGTVCGCEQGVTHFYSPPLHLKTWAGRNRQLSCEYHTGQHGYRQEERGSKRGIPGEKGETIFVK